MRFKFDALSFGLDAALDQLTVGGWKDTEFTSKIVNSCEERWNVKDLE